MKQEKSDAPLAQSVVLLEFISKTNTAGYLNKLRTLSC